MGPARLHRAGHLLPLSWTLPAVMLVDGGGGMVVVMMKGPGPQGVYREY
jgi:hypothetical protein